jgi:hypothetical protein
VDSLAFIDTETTGLHPQIHQVWEVAVIIDDHERCWQLPVDLSVADPFALAKGGYYERTWPAAGAGSGSQWADPDVTKERVDAVMGEFVEAPDGTLDGCTVHPNDVDKWAHTFCTMLQGRTLVGLNTAFDDNRLDRLVRRNGQAPTWHYRPFCVENYIAGHLRIGARWGSSDDLLAKVGVNSADFDRHTALGDARLARAGYTAVPEGDT